MGKGEAMPFVCTPSEGEWDGDPPLDRFHYIAPAEFGGAPEPVKFSLEVPARREAAGGGRGQRDPGLARQELFAIVVPELRRAGVRRILCRYDGGNDEGFATPDAVETEDGRLVEAAALRGPLGEAGVLEKLYAAEVIRRLPDVFPDPPSDHCVLRWLCDEWAAMLLGEGYGAGGYSMYGTFTVDIEGCTIADDRDAGPPAG